MKDNLGKVFLTFYGKYIIVIMFRGKNMIYVPIIKLKRREINKAEYIKSALNHSHVAPFLELRFDPNDERKGYNLNDFLKATNIKKYFLGIPHKPSVVKNTKKESDNDFLANANRTLKKYYDEVQKLFEFTESIPVYYVYNEGDLNLVNDFIEYGHYLERQIGIITTPSLSHKINKKELYLNDYLLIDLEDKTIASQKPNLEKINRETNCRIVLIRENRKSDIYNTQIDTDCPAPLSNDLSTEFESITTNNIRLKLFGFGDYCGFKNDISIDNQRIDSSDFHPAVALYVKDHTPPYYLGIQSDVSKKEGGFPKLLKMVSERLNLLDKNNKTPIKSMIETIKTGDYAIWNVITQWFYISKMASFDDWKNVVIKNY